MSWKAVEMQVALPRIQDASKIQDQMQQRGQHVQEALSNSQVQEDKLKRTQVNDYNQRDNVNNKNKEEKNNKRSPIQHELQVRDDDGFNHPYLGKQIDFNI